MPRPVYPKRSKLIAQGSHPCDLATVVEALTSIHDALRSTFGSACAVHASFNKEELHHLCTLEDMDAPFIRSLFDQYTAPLDQPLLSASMEYRTRTRSARASFHFDSKLESMHISISMPRQGIPRSRVIELAESIIDPLAPLWVVYTNRALIDALYRVYPRYFRTAWLTYHAGFEPELPWFRTIETLETSRGPMAVAKRGWFGRTDEDFLDDLFDLDELIEADAMYEW
jgi:hypothetical protein